MGEEFGRWVEAARPGIPWAVGALVLVAVTAVVMWVLLRQRWTAARESEQRAAHLWHHIDCVVEPTQAIDMRALVAHADKARIDPRRILVHLRERRAAERDMPAPADWTPDELAAVKSMTDRSGWPNTTYRPRGQLPRLPFRRRTREQVAVERVTPLQLGERIKRIKAEQKEKAA